MEKQNSSLPEKNTAKDIGMRLNALNQQSVIKAIAEETSATLRRAWPKCSACEATARHGSRGVSAQELQSILDTQEERLKRHVTQTIRAALEAHRQNPPRRGSSRLWEGLQGASACPELSWEVHPGLLALLMITMSMFMLLPSITT